MIRNLVCFSAAVTAMLFNSCSSDDNTIPVPDVLKPDLEFYALTSSNNLVKLNANNSNTPISTVAITGLTAGENLTAIDFRPATGQLYGLGSNSHLYTIHPASGKATLISATAFTTLTGPYSGFDFNPSVDRIRIVTGSDQNLRINPETGALAATDTSLTPTSATIGAAAYTNNTNATSTTELYVLDYTAGRLNKQDPPNGGILTPIGNLGLTNITAEGGFDIAPDSGIALASLTTGGMNHLYQIGLTTGAAFDLGMLPSNVIGIAIPTRPIAYMVDNVNNLNMFNPANPASVLTKVITGMGGGETVLGMDLRPATGQLFVLGTTGQLYTVNTTTGFATAVGLPLAISGTEFGFDFNPTVDRIRIVSNTGQNLRVDPNTGLIAATDTPLNPGTPSVTAVAYTNSYAGATTTTLYDIDSATDMLYIQNPPNGGVLTGALSLGVNASASNRFDISGNSNLAYALLTVGGTNGLYSINLTTGAATLMATTINSNVHGFAVGLGN